MTVVTLEPIAPRHAEAVQELASHPEVGATTNLPEPYPDGGAAAWIADVQPRHAAGTEYAFAIRNEDGAVVGVVGLVGGSGDAVELGIWIGRPYWRRGYATAAARQAVEFAFSEAGASRVFARPLKRNTASRGLLRSLGFSEGRETSHEHPKWGPEDRFVHYTVTREGWREARNE